MSLTRTSTGSTYLVLVFLLIIVSLSAKDNHNERHHDILLSQYKNHDDSPSLMTSHHLIDENERHPNLRFGTQQQLSSTHRTSLTTSAATTPIKTSSSIRRQLEEMVEEETIKHNVGIVHINDFNEKDEVISSLSSEDISLIKNELAKVTCQELSEMSSWHYTDLNNTKAFINYQQYSDFLEGPGLTKNENDLVYAVCEFIPLMHYQNFAHAMQQVLRCFSWFAGHPLLPRRLLFRDDTFFHNLHTDSIVRFLHKYSIPRIRVVHDDDDHLYDDYIVSPKPATGLIDFSWDTDLLHDFVMLSPNHATEFQKLFYDHLQIHENDPKSTINMTTVGCTATKRIPRIGLLNRMSKKKHNKKFILNDIEIYEAIHKAFPDVIVEYVYLDEMSVEEQIMKMMTVDIVLSSHGSQLQHVMFMPSQGCSSIIELIPPEFFVPDFYGSLCKLFNIHHSFFYTGTDDDLDDMMDSEGHGKDTPYHKVTSMDRKDNIHYCLDTKMVVEAMSKLIENWYSCCDNLMK